MYAYVSLYERVSFVIMHICVLGTVRGWGGEGSGQCMPQDPEASPVVRESPGGVGVGYFQGVRSG